MKNFYIPLYKRVGNIHLMKYFILISLLLSSTILQANSVQQIIKEKKVTINAVNQKLDKILSDINRQTNLEYGYQSKDDIDINKLFTLNVKDVTVEQALKSLFKSSDYAYKIVDNKIVVFRVKEVKAPISQKKVPISGTVVDKESNHPIAGATVIVKQTGAGAITDEFGKFMLIADEGSEISISYVGMADYKYIATLKNAIHVFNLSKSLIKVEDVIVTGYQTLSPRESASAVTVVKAEDVMVTGVSSIDQMLQGKIAGMMVMNTSGEPSATPRIRVRGNSTISGNKAPVWVVDGIILEQTVAFNAADINSEDAAYLIGNAISGLSPQDIQTITVLKDASATAIYGVKAANGVIIITTKKGAIGRPVINYTGDVTVNTRPSYSNFDRMNATERMQLSKDIYDAKLNYPRIPTGDSYEALYDRLLTKKITEEEFQSNIISIQKRNTDWFKEIFRTQISHSHSLNVSGGTEKVRYYFSAGYNDSQGAAIKSTSKRLSTLGKVDVKFNNFIEFTAKIDFSTQENDGYNRSVTTPFNYAYNTSRTLAPYNEDGSYSFYDASSDKLYNYINELNTTGNNTIQDNFNGLLNLKVKIYKGLKYTGTLGYSKNNVSQREWATQYSSVIAGVRGYDYNEYEEGTNEYMKSPLPYGGKLDLFRNNQRSFTVRNDIGFIERFGKHSLNAVAGTEIRSIKYSGVGALGYGWIPEFGESFSPIMTDSYASRLLNTTLPRVTNSITQVASFFGSGAYTFDDRYVINANIRSDGANKFGSNPKYRWLPTWSIAGKWIISSESFMKNQSLFSLLALRASYGIQGNIHDDSTPDLIVRVDGKNSETLQNNSSIVRLPNPDLRWEKTKSWNLALDFTILKDRLKGSIDVYGKNTEDLIMSKQVSTSNGRSFISINAGKMKNYGFEGNIYAELIKKRNFSWNLNFNFSRNVNEVTLANGDAYNNTEHINMLLEGNIAVEGAPIGSMFSYNYQGLSSENGYPYFKARDGRLVHEGEPFMLNLVNSGSIFPILSGGISTEFRIKRALTISVGLNYNIGGVKRLPNVYEDSYRTFDPLANVSNQMINRWKKPGDEKITNIPALIDRNISIPMEYKAVRPGVSGSSNFTRLYNYSDERTAKSDYIRLQMIAVSYDLPSEWLSSIKVSNMRLRLQATNLGVLASKKWNGLDPEMPTVSIPLLPTFSLGVNVSF